MKLRIVFDFFLIALFVSVLTTGYGLAENGSVMPFLVGGLGTILAAWQLWVDLYRFDGNKPSSLSHDNYRQLAWCALLFLAVILLGFLPTAPLWMFCYLRWGRNEGWPVSLGLALAMYGLLWLGFETGMGVTLFNGLLRM